MAHTPASSPRISRRRFLAGTGAVAGAVTLGRAPAVIGQPVRELQVWHTEVEPQTVKVIQDTSIAEFEKKFPGFKVRQQALGWGDLNTKLLASLAAGSPPDLTHLNPFMTASLYTKNLLRPMDELIRSVGESDIHEATRKLQYFDGKYYGITHAMGATYFCERRDLRVKKGLKVPETYDDMLKLCAALTENGRQAFQMPGEKLYMGFVHPAEWLAGNGGAWVDARTWRPLLNGKAMLEALDYAQKLNKFMPGGWSGQKYLDTLAALATDKIAMAHLSGARTIGYIERYAPETMRDPEHFQPMLRPHGPSGQKGVSALATIGSTAPFVGLLGTVVGVINAFQGIGAAGSAGIGAVSVGISEALVETALGLVIAIPAVWFYNYLSSRVEYFNVEMDNSSSELVDYFIRKTA